MITETNAVKLRQNLGEMLNQVQYRHDSVVINKDGKPVAALVDARRFERIRRMQGRFDAPCQRIEAGFAGVPEAEGRAEIDAAVGKERARARRAAGKACSRAYAACRARHQCAVVGHCLSGQRAGEDPRCMAPWLGRGSALQPCSRGVAAGAAPIEAAAWPEPG